MFVVWNLHQAIYISFAIIANGVPGADATSRNRVPLGFYGDSAQLLTRVRKEKLTCFFLNLPLFRPRSIRCSRFLLWRYSATIFEPYHQHHITLDTVVAERIVRGQSTHPIDLKDVI